MSPLALLHNFFDHHHHWTCKTREQVYSVDDEVGMQLELFLLSASVFCATQTESKPWCQVYYSCPWKYGRETQNAQYYVCCYQFTGEILFMCVWSSNWHEMDHPCIIQSFFRAEEAQFSYDLVAHFNSLAQRHVERYVGWHGGGVRQQRHLL